MSWVDVAALDAVPQGRATRVRALDRDLLLCRVGQELFAVAERCTHAAWSLDGAELRGCEIVCAMHGARFDLRTGAPAALPASKPLARWPVRIRGDRVEVELEPRS